LANASNQRLATLDFPSGLILSRVRCIASFGFLLPCGHRCFLICLCCRHRIPPGITRPSVPLPLAPELTRASRLRESRCPPS
jgi:hypothetical protein